MTRKELESLYYLDRIIEQDREQLCRLREAMEHPGHAALTGMPSGGGSGGDKLSAEVARLMELEERIAEEKRRFEVRRAEIYAFCMGIPELWIREIVVWRCVHRWKWRKIGIKAKIGAEAAQMAYLRWCRKNLE